MALLRIFLLAATIMIFAISIYVITIEGINWPVVFFGDLSNFDWRSQFNVDFLIHLFLLAIWVCWREGFNFKGYIFGFLCIFLGGMFGFPYLLVATYRAKGDPILIMLGERASRPV